MFQIFYYFVTKDIADKQQKASYLYAQNIERMRNIFDFVRDELIKLNCKHTEIHHCFIVIQMFMVNEKMIKRKKKSKTQETILNEKYKLELDSDESSESDSDTDSDTDSDFEDISESDNERELHESDEKDNESDSNSDNDD